MDRAKALEKIQKCLALGKSPNEHEAAAAMRQAQNLMRNFDISEKDLGMLGFAEESVQTAIQCGRGAKIPLYLSSIVRLVRHAFGVSAFYSPTLLKTDYNYKVTYVGREDRVMLAAYAHTLIARAVERSWIQHQVDNPWVKGQHGARAGFVIGWISGVREKIEAFANTPEDNKGAQLYIEHNYGKLSPLVPNKQKVQRGTMEAGAEASDGFSIHTPMNGRETVKIGN